MNPPEVQPPVESEEGLMYVHDLEQGVTLPPHPERIFAVVCIKGHQFKVTQDDRVMIESLGEGFEVGQQLILDEVLLVGTPDYTAVGRPTVPKA